MRLSTGRIASCLRTTCRAQLMARAVLTADQGVSNENAYTAVESHVSSILSVVHKRQSWSLRQMQRLPGEVVTEPEGRCVVTSLPQGVGGVSQLRFNKRIARWRDVPFGAEDCISGLEVWVDERTQVEGDVVLKAKYS